VFTVHLALAGGATRLIGLRKEFADEAQPVAMKHLLLAAKREFQKVGRAWEDAAVR